MLGLCKDILDSHPMMEEDMCTIGWSAWGYLFDRAVSCSGCCYYRSSLIYILMHTRVGARVDLPSGRMFNVYKIYYGMYLISVCHCDCPTMPLRFTSWYSQTYARSGPRVNAIDSHSWIPNQLMSMWRQRHVLILTLADWPRYRGNRLLQVMVSAGMLNALIKHRWYI